MLFIQPLELIRWLVFIHSEYTLQLLSSLSNCYNVAVNCELNFFELFVRLIGNLCL